MVCHVKIFAPIMCRLVRFEPWKMICQNRSADVHRVGALADDERIFWNDVLKRRENGVIVQRHRNVARHFVG